MSKFSLGLEAGLSLQCACERDPCPALHSLVAQGVNRVNAGRPAGREEAEDHADGEVVKNDSPQAAINGTETVLLVEDEPIVRAFARQVLTDHGYAVLEAATAEEALFLSNGYDNTIHLLLSDVVLPSGGGPLLAKHLRSQRSNIKVLLMSGYIDRGFSIADNLADTTPFIQKPFTQEVLLQKIRTVLDAPETNSETAQQLSWLK